MIAHTTATATPASNASPRLNGHRSGRRTNNSENASDTPFEADGDQDNPASTEEDEPELDPIERHRIRLLKGKHVLRVAQHQYQQQDETNPAGSRDNTINGVRGHDLESPSPRLSPQSLDPTAPASSAAAQLLVESPTASHTPSSQSIPSRPRHIPEVNVIPTSPLRRSHNAGNDPQRNTAGSLEIPSSNAPTQDQPSSRRRDTVGLSPSPLRSMRRLSFDPRASNRLSGFFSNLLHLRQNAGDLSPPSPLTSPNASQPTPTHNGELRGQDGLPETAQVDRPVTPPPTLPPATLRELGLKMSAISPVVSGANHPSLPTSGVFLAPNYLLLCHSQGLDVLPLNSPPAPSPCALIRRVAFKSVVVMEARGILVAIAGRREAVRVYALDEVRKAVEWRLQVEVEREKEKARESGQKESQWHLKDAIYGATGLGRRSTDRLQPDTPSDNHHGQAPKSPLSSALPTPPLDATFTQPLRSPPPSYASLSPFPAQSTPLTLPGTTSSETTARSSESTEPPVDTAATSAASLSILDTPARSAERARNGSISTVAPPKCDHVIANVGMPPQGAQPGDHGQQTLGQEESDEKGKAGHQWTERDDTDDEALDPVAAGPSASAALDERTSASLNPRIPVPQDTDLSVLPNSSPLNLSGSLASRRNSRPSDLDLTTTVMAQSDSLPVVVSPSPTLMTLRQALSFTGSMSGSLRHPSMAPRSPRASTSLSLNDHDDIAGSGQDTPGHELGEDQISFAQALLESRLPPAAPRAIVSRLASPVMLSDMFPPSSAPPAASNSQSMLSIPMIPTTSAQPGAASLINVDGVEKKQRRRFSIMNGVLGRRSPNSGTAPWQGSSRMAGASASTPNLVESSHPRRHPAATPEPASVSGNPSSGPSTPGQATTNVLRRQSVRSSSQNACPSQPDLRPSPIPETVDRIFQPHVTPPRGSASPIKATQSSDPLSSHRHRASTSSSGPLTQSQAQPPSRTSRFFPRLLNGFKKGSDERRAGDKANSSHRTPSEVEKRLAAGGASSATAGWMGAIAASANNIDLANPAILAQAPAPKLEYVKLPGTKGAIAIKAVETAKKSFLAIVCGEGGEKIELFAGTWRTALGLSRTFILPDSPRSVELQLQGDDLVELFLVFGQNVFGLEPATVRVREVRIGRAERRAARRRAREARMLDAGNDATPTMEDVPQNSNEAVIMTIGRHSLDNPSTETGDLRRSQSRHRRPQPSDAGDNGEANSSTTPNAGESVSNNGHGHGPSMSQEEIAALAAVAQFGPYTTFQQLSFAPAFPLGVIADECIIPPTYGDFLAYRQQEEPDAVSIPDLMQAENVPVSFGPLIPLPPVVPPPPPPPSDKWLYVDPKGVTQGPWKTNLMQTWFNDGFLPPNLPVRREDESEYTLLKELCAKAIDVTHPFRAAPSNPTVTPPPVILDPPKKLLPPMSLLAQPKRFGPPALFYTSRGGHSTTIVDSRGKSVLRGRLNWTADDAESSKLGDIRRIEAFDCKGRHGERERAVIVAIRQGGVEAVDVGDALFYPGDGSRSSLPHFHATSSGTSRRPPFVWRMGSPFDGGGGEPVESIATARLASHQRHGTASTARKAQTINTPTHVGFGTNRGEDGGDGFLVEEEIIHLGRHGDMMYFCERRVDSYRIFGLGTL